MIWPDQLMIFMMSDELAGGVINMLRDIIVAGLTSRKNGKPDYADQDVDDLTQRPQSSAQQRGCKTDKKGLHGNGNQGKGYDNIGSNRDTDKSPA